jgi:hypothetical protein
VLSTNPATNSILTLKPAVSTTAAGDRCKDWAPRIGLAYTIDPKTVVRSGYGISYVHLNRLGSADDSASTGAGQQYHQPIRTVEQSGFITTGNSFAGLNGPANSTR